MVRNIVYNDYPHNIFKLKSERFKQARTNAVERRKRIELIKDPFKSLKDAVEKIAEGFRQLAKAYLEAVKPIVEGVNQFLNQFKQIKNNNRCLNPYFKYDTKIKIIRTGENP